MYFGAFYVLAYLPQNVASWVCMGHTTGPRSPLSPVYLLNFPIFPAVPPEKSVAETPHVNHFMQANFLSHDRVWQIWFCFQMVHYAYVTTHVQLWNQGRYTVKGLYRKPGVTSDSISSSYEYIYSGSSDFFKSLKKYCKSGTLLLSLRHFPRHSSRTLL